MRVLNSRASALVIAAGVLAAACSSGGSAQPEPGSPSTTRTVAEPGSPTTATQTTAELQTTTSTLLGGSSSTPTDGLFFPQEAGYFDAVGADAVRITTESQGAVGGSQQIIEFGRSGRIFMQTTGFDPVEEWFDGEHFYARDETGKLRPSISTAARIRPVVARGQLVAAFIEQPARSSAPVGTVDRDGQTLTEYFVEGEAVIEQLAFDSETFEVSAATQRLLTNEAGAMISLEITSEGTSPSVGEYTSRSLSTVEPIDAVRELPTAEIIADADDVLTRSYLDAAIAAAQSARRDAEPDDTLSTADIDDRLQRRWLPRPFVVRDMAEAGTTTVGYAEDVFVLQSPSGEWLCTFWNNVEQQQTGQGTSLEEAVAACTP